MTGDLERTGRGACVVTYWLKTDLRSMQGDSPDRGLGWVVGLT